MHNLLEASFFITAANVLYVLSYLVRDILWLRILTEEDHSWLHTRRRRTRAEYRRV